MILVSLLFVFAQQFTIKWKILFPFHLPSTSHGSYRFSLCSKQFLPLSQQFVIYLCPVKEFILWKWCTFLEQTYTCWNQKVVRNSSCKTQGNTVLIRINYCEFSTKKIHISVTKNKISIKFCMDQGIPVSGNLSWFERAPKGTS